MNKAVSDKKVVKTLVDICLSEGLREVVISPGSRNAPLTLTFCANPEFECFSVVDERSAGFFALGIAQQTGRPVALVCTSGSALLNYAPAISEAYYQNIPLVVISADRPQEWIDQADGQTIRQVGALDNIVKYSCQLPTSKNASNWYVNRLISEAFYQCQHKMAGPVHINVPLAEPLYGKTVHPEEKQRRIKQVVSSSSVSAEAMQQLSEDWLKHDKILIVAGLNKPNGRMQQALRQLSEMEQVVVLTETTSNINGESIITGIDKVVSTITEEEVHFFKPSLLITFDGAVVSKMIKKFLRDYQAKEQWHISVSNHHMDTYQQLTTSIEAEPADFLEDLLPKVTSIKSRYRTTWLNRAERSDKHHEEYLAKNGWNDLKAIAHIASALPEKWQVQWGNSSAIRYAQLFKEFYNEDTYCNRGTSGIDGSLSTAVGASYISQKPTLLVVGDLSFLYDSNGLWNNYLQSNLRIIIINNGGGGIFRFIPGPSDSEELETYFEAAHQLNMQPLAEMYGLKYLRADNEEAMNDCLTQLFSESDKPIILEVKTPAKENAGVLKSYFKRLKEEL
ncbi:2-succinyl-5-enolpyruvyl-6-hydroxy-3-cyclohexene-1-carboxylic-acid synthase [Carboxylicivirga mesophila]|uniref:2-succinyl-5-enolpyruvyl-6-hydroxy-3-cyclohexene-1-carboxylate synthase n=1 Tax=Carboxylicivirga mesophila TaxID=1166478 RepID=A0ABS5K939_9BACT|nr:2-succinyl-5-enolpyruvyl-6-hydroxy-3-cyclohexene-1-carboxylic-acid synthase [Carboxylicivirga mesophila]MBS2211058.1 2-succinyl-5-enolpyruvyl-6-hydroxy-3-cyclohexene-1-carboxylic-acid synthase [Carboxylicivirga mesophila]